VITLWNDLRHVMQYMKVFGVELYKLSTRSTSVCFGLIRSFTCTTRKAGCGCADDSDDDDEVYMSVANDDQLSAAAASDSVIDMSTCSMSTSQTSTTAGLCQVYQSDIHHKPD